MSENHTEHDFNWDMSQERAFIENLLAQRFNFFLVFFSIVILGAVTTKSVANFKIILVMGSIICWMLSGAIYRAQEKFDIIFRELKSIPTHPIAIIDNKTSSIGSARHVIGYIIPIICSAAISTGAVLALLGVLKP